MTSRGIRLVVEGKCDVGVSYIPKANTNIAWVNLQYISALHPCWAST